MTTLTRGIDLSHHQDPKGVPWERIGGECAFVICRATYGTTRDRQVTEHMRRARSEGVRVGLYHFFRSVQRLDDQLAAFSAAAEAAGYQVGDIVPAIDVEDDPKVADVSPSWMPSVHAFALACEERFGGRPIVYITQRDWIRAGKPQWMLHHPLWVAHYTTRSAPATPANTPWLIWQHRVGPFDPAGPGGSYQPGLFDHNLCCGELPSVGKTTEGATAPEDTGTAEPSWEELRHRVETMQALWFDGQIHRDDDESA